MWEPAKNMKQVKCRRVRGQNQRQGETRACAPTPPRTSRCKVDALTSAARVENASISANNATEAGPWTSRINVLSRRGHSSAAPSALVVSSLLSRSLFSSRTLFIPSHLL
jgi:hypothetical protein